MAVDKLPEIFSKVFRVILKEWLLTGAFSGCLLTSLLDKRLPRYTRQDAEILFILWVYLALIKGLERGKFFKALASRLSLGRMIGLKLVSGVFFLTMFVTNDAAVLIGVPLVINEGVFKWTFLFGDPFLFFVPKKGTDSNDGGLLMLSVIYW